MVRRKNNRSVTPAAKKRKQNKPYCSAFIGNKVFKVTHRLILEIHDLQRRTDRLIPQLPFARLVKEIMQGMCNYRIQSLALQYLHEAAEVYLVEFLEGSYKWSAHAGRITLMPKDVRFEKESRYRYEPFLL